MSSAGESTSELTADLATESGGTGSDTVGSSGSDSRATSANRGSVIKVLLYVSSYRILLALTKIASCVATRLGF